MSNPMNIINGDYFRGNKLPIIKQTENPINLCFKVRVGKQLSFLALEAIKKAVFSIGDVVY